jgi:hypothetical protein
MIALSVNYLGAKVGTLAETRQGIVFEFDPVFLASGHDLSPPTRWNPEHASARFV